MMKISLRVVLQPQRAREAGEDGRVVLEPQRAGETGEVERVF